MFPIRWNFPFRKQDGSLSTIGAEISGGGGGGYTLPTASADTKGGVKIGDGLTMTGEVLSVDAELPSYSVSEAGKVLGVDNEGHLAWVTVSAGVRNYTKGNSPVPDKEITTSAKEVV